MAATCSTFASALDAQGWVNDPAQAPAVSEADIHRYFGETTPISARQTLRGWSFKEEKFIRNVQFLRNNDNNCYVKSTCLPSMKAGHYKQLVVIEDNPVTILHAYCQCTAGLSQTCQHVAGLLYALVAIKTPSSTDTACTWVVPRNAQKRPAPTELDKVRFWKVKEGKAARDQPKQRSAKAMTSTAGDPLHVLALSVKKAAPNVLWLRYADDGDSKPTPSPLLPDTEDLLSKNAQSLCDEHFAAIGPLSLEEVERIRTTTIGQAGNDNWFKERAGRITASNFKKAVSCVKPEGLVREILYPKTPNSRSNLHPSDPRRYGLETEPVAVEAYRHWCRLQDKDTVVTSTGLHIHERFPFLGASPDGLVREAGEDGLLEVKCPKSKAGMTPREACADKKFCSEFVNGEVTLKTDHAFYYQVQGQLAVTGCQWCDFVIYTNNKTLPKSLAVERIYFDKNFWQTFLLPGLLYFYKRAVIPEVLTKRMQRMNMLYTCGPGYLPFKKHVKGYYTCTLDERSLKVTIRKL